jgi:RNA polymerase sigma-70 factor (family 1)
MREKEFDTEQKMIDEFRKGSQKSFAKLFHQLYPALCFYATRFTDDHGEAEDIVEESFIKVWERRETFNHYKVLRSFLYATIRNACLNWIKQKERHLAHEKAIGIQSESSESSILENTVRAEVFLDVYDAFEKLPPKCREIIDMVFFEGKNIREISNELNLSINTVKAQKRRGLLLLRNKLTVFLLLSIIG